MSGHIHTFYSYKGGVGRSLCLANVGVLLARWGWKVLCIDMDLEAPGLTKYFANILEESCLNGGVVDWLTEISNGNSAAGWDSHILPCEYSQLDGQLSVLPAGAEMNEEYLKNVQGIDWNRLYVEHRLGDILEAFKTSLKAQYDFILIDSRTGVSDSGGICTIQLPDAITFFFTPNQQSLYGAAHTMRQIQKARLSSVTEPGAAMMLPVLTRFDREHEYRMAQEWRERIMEEIAEFYLSWFPLPPNFPVKSDTGSDEYLSSGLQRLLDPLLDATTVPQIPFWGFGEPLPVLEEIDPAKDMISFAFENIAAIIANRFANTDHLLNGRISYLMGARKPEHDAEMSVFISHDKSQEEMVRGLTDSLRDRGVMVRLATDIHAGKAWREEIEQGIRKSDSLVVIDSGQRSRQVDDEISTFIRTRSDESINLRIVPVTLEPDKRNPLLQGFHGVDGWSQTSEVMDLNLLADNINKALHRFGSNP